MIALWFLLAAFHGVTYSYFDNRDSLVWFIACTVLWKHELDKLPKD
jgi:hypothetical protein